MPRRKRRSPFYYDQQIRLEPGVTTAYVESALKIQNGEGLAAGNLSLPWDPATEKVTVHKLLIIRDGETIDVLQSGQTFTTMRREQNLDTAMLDGRLTANIQPEGLQQGDVLVLATSVEHRDPVLKNHVQSQFGMWNGVPVQAARARLLWPDQVKLKVQQTNLPDIKPVRRGGENQVEIAMTDAQPLLFPSGAPLRFSVGRYAEASDFASWAEVADLIAPHYQAASKIPASGPLRDEVEKLRKVTDKRAQVEQALALVQDRVRYVALLMGEGGYVPASAESTWSRRFGDCKGKTTLLLGILHELGVKADAVLVNSSAGDLISGRLPMLNVFDHVLVRAELNGKTYWLDGTRSGDGSLDAIDVPEFSWGLPIVTSAKLVAINPPPLTVPDTEVAVSIDATQGVFAPATFKVERILRGDTARATNTVLAKLSPAQLQQTQTGFWKQTYDYVTPKETKFTFDRKKAELRLTMSGEAKLEWKDNWFYVPNSNLAYEPDFERTSGINRDAPFALAYPNYEVSHVEIRFPPGFSPSQPKIPAPVRETLAGVEYSRTVKLENNMLTLDRAERTILPEIAYKDAQAAAGRLKALANDDVYLRVSSGYQMTEGDRKVRISEKPASAQSFIDRGLLLLDAGKTDEAIADFDEAVKLDPQNSYAWANRGIAHAWKNDGKEAPDLAKAAELDPDNPVVPRGRAVAAEMRGDFPTAIKEYTVAIEKDPNTFAYMHRASSYYAAGEPQKALADTDELLKKGQKSANVRLLRANILRGQGDDVGALREAELLISENPDATYPQVAAARIFASLGKKDRAMKAFDGALAIKQESYIYVNRAQSRPRSDMPGKMADIEAALKIEPTNVDALLVKAELLVDQGKLPEALAAYESLSKNEDANWTWTKAQRGIVLAKLGRTDEARKLFAVARSESKSAQQLNNLCWAKATANVEIETALDDCREAVRKEPDSGAYLDSLGLALLRSGKLDEAIAAYDKAIAVRTGASSLMGRAIVKDRKGDAAGAASDRASAIKLSADIEDVYRGYGLEIGGKPTATQANASSS
ncbi:tetratricopeptide repeat protein [Sphingomonas daechungensis]|uniref:tetratricopeptide repeat protein n=1 Tax=Sphingomonas daechungensis TaxID=1176646 RepID=UPI0037842AD9